MKMIKMVSLLMMLSACSQNEIQLPKKNKIGIHILTSKGIDSQLVNWYYIRDRNTSREKGYYFESKEPVQNFINANFVYYNSRPDKLNEIYPLKEQLILIDANDLPANIRPGVSGLESITVRE